MTTYTPEEQKAHRKLWVEALRSGEYEQTQTRLRDAENRSMCCLGVACEVSGLGSWTSDGDYRVVAENREELVGDLLPPSVQSWLGLSENGGERLDGPALYEENDDFDKSFDEIADIIESEPEGLIATTPPALSMEGSV